MALQDDGNIIIAEITDERMKWFCAPDSWKPLTVGVAAREGRDGSWRQQGHSMIIYPPAKKDYWRKTYYVPVLLKDDGPFWHFSDLARENYYTITTTFDLTAVCQFDQAGLMVRFDEEHWIKTGIEVVDGLPRLSCVVTNEFSDWSTQHWPHYSTTDAESKSVCVPKVSMRVHCRGNSFVVEARMENGKWEFIRIAHLNVGKNLSLFSAGVFACCPADQQGGHAVFENFVISSGSHMEHNADGNQE